MHKPPALRTIRRVWAAVSQDPQATDEAIGRQVRRVKSTVAAAMRVLKDAGYIDYEKYSAHAREVLLPFKVDKRIRIVKRS
jgi:Mn-dependent DtxR family transcriptional regulator